MSGNGYYGRPIVKPPEWSWLIPTYFWAGGMGGTCAALACAARLRKNDALARTLWFGAAAATGVSGACLIADLKRPERFLHMLRVFKPSSPMSVGVYIFSLFGAATTFAAASELTGIARPLGRIAEKLAGAVGPVMSVYTAVLIGDTAMPAWHYARTSLPMLFAATSASTAGGFGMLFAPVAAAKAARRLALIGGVGAPLALERLRLELGPAQHAAYERGKAARFSAVARAFNAAGTLCTLLAGKNRRAAQVGGILLLAAGLAERFAVFHAGRISAEDPSFTLAAQEPGASATSATAVSP